jgi:hypothetical protein
MTPARIVTAFGLAAVLVAVPTLADAQSRRGPSTGRAVRRAGPPPRSGAVRTYRPPYYRPYYYRPYYYRPYYYTPLLGYSGLYGPYAYGYAFGYPAYGYGGYGYGYPGYGYPGYSGYGYSGAYRAYGGVRIDLEERDAEVYVDGYYAGVVDDFDGNFQQLNVEPGPHRIEVRASGFAPITFDVNVEPGRTITYRSALRPERP